MAQQTSDIEAELSVPQGKIASHNLAQRDHCDMREALHDVRLLKERRGYEMSGMHTRIRATILIGLMSIPFIGLVSWGMLEPSVRSTASIVIWSSLIVACVATAIVLAFVYLQFSVYVTVDEERDLVGVRLFQWKREVFANQWKRQDAKLLICPYRSIVRNRMGMTTSVKGQVLMLQLSEDWRFVIRAVRDRSDIGTHVLHEASQALPSELRFDVQTSESEVVLQGARG